MDSYTIASFLTQMDDIADFFFDMVVQAWSVISSSPILFCGFSLVLVSLVFLFFRKLRHII